MLRYVLVYYVRDAGRILLYPSIFSPMLRILRYPPTLPLAVLAALVVAVVVLWPASDLAEHNRATHGEFVNDYIAEVNARPETKGPPGNATPGEAAEFEYIRTMDPATRTVPHEELLRANAIGAEQISLGKSGIAAVPMATTPWTERGPNNWGGRTRAVMWDPNVPNRVWAGGVSGGLWKNPDITTDGVPWIAQNDFWENLAVSAIAYDPTNTQVFYVGTGEGYFNIDAVQGGGIWKTTDGGLTFSPLASTNPATAPSFSFVNDIVVTAAGTVLAATREGRGVQRSTDGGLTWTSVLNATVQPAAATNRAADLEIDAKGDIYAAMGIFSRGTVWRSTDDGQTWTFVVWATSSTRIDVCTAPSDANVVYALFHNPAIMAKSVDGGTSWVVVPTPPIRLSTQGWYNLICAVDPNNPNRVYAGAIDMARSDDGGITWTPMGNTAGGPGTPAPIERDPHPDQHAIVFRPGSSSEFVNGNDGGMYYVGNAEIAGNPTFVKRSDGYNVTQFYGGAIHPGAASNVILGGTQDNAVQYFNQPGIESSTYVFGGDGGNNIIDQDDPNFAIALAFDSFSSRSFDGGSTRAGFDSGLFLCPAGSGCDNNISSDLFIAATDFDDREDLFFLTGGTGNFTRVHNLKPAAVTPVATSINVAGMVNPASAITASPFSTPGTSTVIIGTSGGQVFRVEGVQPGGTPVVTNLTGTINPGYVSSIEFGATANQLLLTVSNYNVNSVYESLDGGATWTNKDNGSLPNMPVRWAMYNPADRDQVILATESGIWETTDFSSPSPTWMRVPGFPTVRVDQFQYRPSDDQVTAFTHGRGIFNATFLREPTVPLECLDPSTAPSYAGGYVLNSAGTRAFVLLNAPTGAVMAEFYNTANLAVSAPETGKDSNTPVGGVTRVGDVFTFTPASPGMVYFPIARADPNVSGVSFFLRVTDSCGRVVDVDPSFMVTGVDVDASHPFALSPIAPNPVVGKASIRFSLAEASSATLSVYDMLGREVAVLVDGTLSSGAHEASFDGSALPAGLYVYRLRAGKQMLQRTLTVAR